MPFSDYAFNKAHSAAYGLVSYWTAYLKANYPAEYMAALLTSVKDDKDKSAIYLNECRRMKIKVLPPDVNESDANFTPVGNDIRFGLTAIRNVGANVVDGDRRGPRGRRAATPTSTTSWTRSPALVCNKRVIESLIKAGAFDDMKHTRRALVAIHEHGRRPVRRHQAQRGDRPGLPVRRPRRRRRRRLRHRGRGPRDRRVGQDDAARPRAGDARPLRLRPPAARPRARARPAAADCTIGQLMLDEERARRHARSPITGLITSVQRKITKQRRHLGDGHRSRTSTARIDVLLFPSAYQLASTLLAEDAIVTVKGRLSREQGPARDPRPGGHASPTSPTARPARW